MLEVQPVLFPLLSQAKGAARVIKRGDPLPSFDLHCPIMSLPLAFATRLDTIPAEVPYLDVPADRLRTWRERLPEHGLRIAFAWAGSATHRLDRQRSVPLGKLKPLFEAKGSFEWLSVQRDLRDGDRELLGSHANIKPLGEQLADFADTAAIIAHADLVVTVDTAVAHLAGALGRPVWILVQYSPDFRWLLDRDDSPWYPSARLFRQTRFGEWDDVIASVAAALMRRGCAR